MTKHSASTKDTVEALFERLLGVTDHTNPAERRLLGQLKLRLLEEEVEKKPAKDFTFKDVIATFKLKYSQNLRLSLASPSESVWAIEDSVTSPFPLSPCLSELMKNYSENYVRSSEALCRTALDIILIECLTVMKKKTVVGTEETGDRQPSTPGPWDDIKVHGEISFNHRTLFEPPTNSSTSTPAGTIISGRVDYGIGRVLTVAQKQRFQSLLVIVEAKTDRSVDNALPQLLVYLACLHQSRLRGHRRDASVYGVASDGFLFIFVKITHDGNVKISRQFNVGLGGDIGKIMGCLKYILELTADMSPNVTPERNNGDKMDIEDPADDSFDLDDNAYTTALDDDGDP